MEASARSERRREAVDLAGHALKLLTDGVADQPADDLAATLQALEHVRRQVEAATVTVIAHAERGGAPGVDGHQAVSTWVTATINTSPVDARDRARLAHLSNAVPSVLDELAAGRLGVAQARELGRLYANPRVRDQLPGVADQLVESAQHDPFERFRDLCRSWEQLADADGAHRTHDQAHTGRRAQLVTVGETTYLDAACGNAQGSVMAAIFERFVDAEFHAEWDRLKARHGDDMCAGLLERTAAQRRADALYAIFQRAASHVPGEVEPTVNIVIAQDVFEAQLAAMAAGRRPHFAADDLGACWAVTTTGALLDPADVVAAAFVGHVRRVVIDQHGVIVNFGQRRRVFTGRAREAAVLQAFLQTGGRCLWPGCGRRRTQQDHTEPWGAGGPTDLANAGPLCAHHNRFKTRGYRTWRDAAGRWHTARPDGTPLEAA